MLTYSIGRLLYIEFTICYSYDLGIKIDRIEKLNETR